LGLGWWYVNGVTIDIKEILGGGDSDKSAGDCYSCNKKSGVKKRRCIGLVCGNRDREG